MNIVELRERYVRLFGNEPAAAGAVARLEAALEVVVPEDFKEIASFYSGGLVGVSHFQTDPDDSGDTIVEHTLRLRSSAELPLRFVVLAEPAESLVVLDTGAGGGNAVIWCDAGDIANLEQGDLHRPDTWPTYAAFFAYLLDVEEDERAAD